MGIKISAPKGTCHDTNNRTDNEVLPRGGADRTHEDRPSRRGDCRERPARDCQRVSRRRRTAHRVRRRAHAKETGSRPRRLHGARDHAPLRLELRLPAARDIRQVVPSLLRRRGLGNPAARHPRVPRKGTALRPPVRGNPLPRQGVVQPPDGRALVRRHDDAGVRCAQRRRPPPRQIRCHSA